ncbi:uncharacterized protein KIAA1755 homolog isoform X2 [Perognathus longimembris pacificus]|uniref:uncharacterized protein KIAA1755 homolog isoform X2 n=1 Tax=Perognathus longimembris pacificus TaxID=214514 RepID=UPI002019C776|nr:uncharacterized protein KIAA1755 homolog isoform X2 [Perognathus longimembris pacificus]
MEPPSLDTAIQHALAGLYPPFEATAPTVLGQVFRLLDSDFRGDGLSFLLDFLIPAKRLCEQVREAACDPYVHHVFLHEGWPLCLRDEVVVHLAPLNPLLLRQGDFYFQVESWEEQSARMVMKCLSLDLRTVDKKPVPESSYPLLFTQQWLETINSSFQGSPLHNCLVASEHGVVPVPWNKIASPIFVEYGCHMVKVPSSAEDTLQFEASHPSNSPELPQADSPGSRRSPAQSVSKGKDGRPANKYPGLIKVEQARPGEVAFRMDDVVSQSLEGDYVALVSFSHGSRGHSPSRQVATSSGWTLRTQEELSRMTEIPMSPGRLSLQGPSAGPSLDNQACAKPASSEEEPCALGSKRKISHQVTVHHSEPQSPEPFFEALEPPGCTSGLGTNVPEEPAVSKTRGLLESPETMTRPGPRQASSPRLSPASSACETKTDKTLREKGGPRRPSTQAVQNASSSSGSPIPGLKSSFSKGQKLPLVTEEKSTLLRDASQKTPCPVYSAKTPQKDGTTPTNTSGPATESSPPSAEPVGFPEASLAFLERNTSSEEEPPGPGPRIGALCVEFLYSRIACLPGGRDRAGRPLLLLSTQGDWEAPWCQVSELTKLLSYLCSIPRPEEKAKGLAVVIDARKEPPQPGLVRALQATQAVAPERGMLFFLGEKEAALLLQALPAAQVEVLTSLKALSHHVDSSQLPDTLEGSFPYCHSEWVQFFQMLDPFLADLRRASSLLQASIEEFEKGEPTGGAQEATRDLSKSKELMAAVLRDPGLLGLQREGGAVLAGLQGQASRLPSNPDIRCHLDEAAALYSLVDEQLHVLVTVSNHHLGRLELRIRLGRLEAAIHQVSAWMEREGSQCLRVLEPADDRAESVEKAHAAFEDFFLQAAAQYRRGLELSKQAAQLGAAGGGAGEAGSGGGPGFPELAAFAATQRAFQAKLTHFYMAAERQRTDLETLLHLHRFCKKMTWFHLDCQDLMAQLRLGKAQRASPGDQRRLQRYLWRLESEFPAEKLTAMKLQVASLSRAGLGQALWEEAQVRHEEIQNLLKKALARCPCPAAPTAQFSRPAAKGQGPSGVVPSRGTWDLPFQDALGVNHLPKPCWPPLVPRAGQHRNFQADPPRQEAGQAEAGESQGPYELGKTFPEHILNTFSLKPFPRPSQLPHPTGGGFSSEGTDSQTSLESSPQTSPPASL